MADETNQAASKAASDDLAELYAPDHCDSCSHDGKSYACKDGKVRVPHAAVAALVQHGFSVSKPKGRK